MNDTKRKVDFIIAGTQKGGTTGLCKHLIFHPEICMARKKEVHYFDNEEIFSRSILDYSIYHSFFRPGPTHKILGEATPSYMYWRDAPRRIWQYNSKMKIIAILRNPIERAFSAWSMEIRRHWDTLPFWDAILNEETRCRESLPYQHQVYSYIDRGFYVEQIRNLWRFFPREQTLFLKSEDIWSNQRDALNTVCRFLGVSCMTHINTGVVFSGTYATAMSERERAYLRKIFKNEILSLENLLGWDCSSWLID